MWRVFKGFRLACPEFGQADSLHDSQLRVQKGGVGEEVTLFQPPGHAKEVFLFQVWYVQLLQFALV